MTTHAPTMAVLIVIGFLIAFVLLVMLIVAPMKLYGIHREVKLTNAWLTNTNEHLKYLGTLLVQISEREQAQVRLLAAMANESSSQGQRPGGPTGSGS